MSQRLLSGSCLPGPCDSGAGSKSCWAAIGASLGGPARDPSKLSIARGSRVGSRRSTATANGQEVRQRGPRHPSSHRTRSSTLPYRTLLLYYSTAFSHRVRHPVRRTPPASSGAHQQTHLNSPSGRKGKREFESNSTARVWKES